MGSPNIGRTPQSDTSTISESVDFPLKLLKTSHIHSIELIEQLGGIFLFVKLSTGRVKKKAVVTPAD